jgi:hypothetical protein
MRYPQKKTTFMLWLIICTRINSGNVYLPYLPSITNLISIIVFMEFSNKISML